MLIVRIEEDILTGNRLGPCYLGKVSKAFLGIHWTVYFVVRDQLPEQINESTQSVTLQLNYRRYLFCTVGSPHVSTNRGWLVSHKSTHTTLYIINECGNICHVYPSCPLTGCATSCLCFTTLEECASECMGPTTPHNEVSTL